VSSAGRAPLSPLFPGFSFLPDIAQPGNATTFLPERTINEQGPVKIGAYVLRRLLLSIPVLIGVTILTFGISWQANEGHMERAYLSEKMTPAQRERIIEQYGFDEPWYAQYFSYLMRLVQLDLGFSRVEGDRPVLEVYSEFLPATLELTLVAMAIAVFSGIALGSLTAVRKDSPVDHATRFLALSGVSVPIFWLGLVLKFAFATAYPVELFTEAGPLAKTAMLAVAFGLPILAGAFAADAIDPKRLTWRRLAVHVGILAAAVALLFWLEWRFAATVLLMVGATAYAIALLLHLRKAEAVPRLAWKVVAAGVVVAAAGIAFSPVANDAVRGVFDLIPDFPLGGRFSNDLIQDPDAHPVLTGVCEGPLFLDGCTRVLLVDTALAGDWEAFGNVLHHLVLPGFTLGYASLAVMARMMRSSMLEVLPLDFIRTARAKGLPESQVIQRHARRNALIPIATVIGLTFGSLLSGAVLTETIFQWPGLGRWSTKAIGAFDTTSVMSFTLLVVVIYLLANFLVDIMYSVLDPRVRLS
jgi:peptide/nickel transport system permease protein